MFYGYVKENLKPFFGGCGVRKNERDKEKVRSIVRKKEYVLWAFCPHSLRPSYFSCAWLAHAICRGHFLEPQKAVVHMCLGISFPGESVFISDS